MLSLSFALFYILLINANLTNSQYCDSNYIGNTDCVLLTPYYSTHQWATCLTNKYIKEKTKNRFSCRGGSTYCWYQCMVEEFELDQGPVYDTCKCSTNQTADLNLPNHCYSPDGTDCGWYEECLEKKYKCSQTNVDYGITYAKNFCEKYNQNYNNFTDKGKQWVDGVRKCLQVSLVFTLRPWNNLSCSDIKKIAFSSHSPCYIKPDSSAPSICYLNPKDWALVFVTIKEAYSSEFWESLKGFFSVSLGCTGHYIIDPLVSFIKQIKIVFKKTFSKNNVNDVDYLIQSTSISIGRQLNWKDTELSWFMYTNESNSKPDELNAYLWIVSKNDLFTNATQSKSILDELINGFEKSFSSGQLDVSIEIGNEKKYPLYMAECKSDDCKSVSNQVNYVIPDLITCNGKCNNGSYLFKKNSIFALIYGLVFISLVLNL